MAQNKHTMKTIKDYTTIFMGYGEITIPAGTAVTNQTACGIDKNYNFVNEFGWVKTNYPEIANILLHDLTYHGINVPAEFVAGTMDAQDTTPKNGLIATSEKLSNTIREFYESKEFEKCDYCINPQPDRDNWFFMIDIKSGVIVADGQPTRIKAYIKLRGINPDRVYKYSYIDNKFITIID